MRSGLKGSRRALGALVLVGCQLGQGAETMRQRETHATRAIVVLPAPRRDGRLSLEAALQRRRSIRSFTRDSLSTSDVAQLLWAAQGITDPEGFRTAPSAGALYPLECYVATSSGVFRYEPASHRLRQHLGGDVRGSLASAAGGQSAVSEAAAVFVVTATYERTARKYGDERARRYAVLEAGHAAQNVLLEAVALGLGAVPVGAFDDEGVARLLRLAPGEAPLYLIPVGHP